MVVWATRETACPMCGRRLRIREVGGGFATGQDSDLFVRMKGKHVILAAIHTCQGCRYSGTADDFLLDVSPEMRGAFLRQVAPALAAEDGEPVVRKKGGNTPLPHVQYLWAAQAAHALGLPSQVEGMRYVRAYWCLRTGPSSRLTEKKRVRLMRKYLRAAIQRLRHELRFQKDSNLVYLVAELCRRNKNFALAMSYFRRFLEREEGAVYLKQAAAKLYASARAQDSSPFTMEELLYHRTPREDGEPKE